MNQSLADQESTALVTGLSDRGLDAQASASLGRLLDALARRGKRTCCIILQGEVLPLLHALGFIRALHANLPVAVSTGLSSQDQLVALLAAGADFLLPDDAGIELMAAAASAMIRSQLGTARRKMPKKKGMRWELNRKTAELVAPDGTQTGLTDLEMALLHGVFSAPDCRIARTDLLRLVLPEQALTHPRQAASYLGVLISRLRSKLRNNGLELPLSSIHGWGYRFTEPV